jgi:pyruvate/2-oxoglutarate dehydrogenase complex dihydrolipoamide acyltransferase (E2) component
MARKVILSSLGIDIQEAEIIEFKKKLGDKVKRGDIIANVESQKVSFEVVSPIDGVILEIFYKERDTIKVGDTIAIVGEENENISEYIANNSYTEKKVVNKKVKLERDKRIKVFPSARKLAEKHDIDLCKVKSSVESEIISKKDVEEYLNKKLKYEEINDVEGYEVVEFTGSRKIIADRMLSSIQNAAHVTTIIEIDMTDVRIIKEKYRKTHGKVSYMAFIIKAIIDGIKEVPIINSIIKENKILVSKKINLSVAISASNGLKVPVLKNVNDLGIFDISKSLEKIISLTKENKLTMEDVKEGTITLSNGGVFGPIMNTPIINPPQVAIVWVGSINKKPAVYKNKIQIRDLMYLCLSYDHRVIDGKDAGTFILNVKKYLENIEI